MKRLTTKEVKEYRDAQLIAQGHCCALCGEPIIDDPVFDHCHSRGHMRGVLHRGCNAIEGVITNNMRRNRIDEQRLQAIFENFIEYRKNNLGILHPSHRTPEEKALLKKKRAKKRKSQINK